MNRLWAPWRKAYIRPEGKKEKGCLFCRLQNSKKDSQNLILHRNPTCYAVLNLYPYTNGHVLIVPNRHVDDISRLNPEEKLDWLDLTGKVVKSIQNHMKPDGINYGINWGKAAGAGVPKHLHLHIVPRWVGDHNFMPIVAKAKVISESLNSVYKTLTAALKFSYKK